MRSVTGYVPGTEAHSGFYVPLPQSRNSVLDRMVLCHNELRRIREQTTPINIKSACVGEAVEAYSGPSARKATVSCLQLPRQVNRISITSVDFATL